MFNEKLPRTDTLGERAHRAGLTGQEGAGSGREAEHGIDRQCCKRDAAAVANVAAGCRLHQYPVAILRYLQMKYAASFPSQSNHEN